MELIYTQKRTGFEAGKHYRNPRFFDRPEAGVTRVTLDGDYPHIAAAYEAANVPVSGQQAKAVPKTQPEPTEPPTEAAESDKPKRGRSRKAQE
ncbi:hypothetical protein RVM26_04820 [Halomonas sp. KM072]